MGSLNIKWNKRAQKRADEIATWYADNCGMSFAVKFMRGIQHTVNLLSQSPQIGMLDEKQSTDQTKYYSFLSHPKFRILYRYTSTILYVVAIRATQMNQ